MVFLIAFNVKNSDVTCLRQSMPLVNYCDVGQIINVGESGKG